MIMGESMQLIKSKVNKAKLNEMVDSYAKALQNTITEEQLATILLTASKEDLACYIIYGYEAVKSTYGRQIEILMKKGMKPPLP